MKYTLILNSNKNNWPTDQNLCFLGHWCLEQIKDSFRNISKYKLINKIKKNDKDVDQDVDNMIKIYSSLQKDIKFFLNNFHRVSYSDRFWEIIIGPWLKTFIGIVYQRYTSLENALKDEMIDNILLVKSNLDDLSTNNVSDLEYKASKNINEWNTILYTHIFENLNTTHKQIKFNHKIEKKTEVHKKNIKSFFMKFLGLINFLNLKKKYFIYGADLKFKYIILLNYYLKQIPFVTLKINYNFKDINLEKRNNFNFKKSNISEIESFIRKILPFSIPTDLIENFENLINISNQANWPKNPLKIFTSVSFHGDEVFKFYLAQNVEKNSLYISHQHGSNYFTGKNTIIQTDYDTCDKFLSWGENSQKKAHSLFNTKNISFKKLIKNRGKKLLVMSPKWSSMRKRPYDDYGLMINESFTLENLLFNLDTKIKKKVLIKAHSDVYDSKKLEKKILEEIIFKRDKYIINRSQLNNKLVRESKIVLHPGDYTGFLESLAIGIPTICVQSNLNWIRYSAKKDYEKLIEAKILFTSSKEAADHINNIFYDVENWWNDPFVLNIREKFCKKYSKEAPKNPIKKIAEMIIRQN